MNRSIVLDAGPLWLACSAVGKPLADACRAWLASVLTSGREVFLPEIADFEVRRELLRRRATGCIRRLDALRRSLDFRAIESPAMLLAAESWADLRRAGLSTADPLSLDADCILAAQAVLCVPPGEIASIATTNIRHLNRFPGINAEEWNKIAP